MEKSDYKNMWVHVEHNGQSVSPVSLELCCEIRKLCDQSGDALTAVVPGALPETELQKLEECGVDQMILVSGTGYDRYNTEAFSNLYTVLCKKYHPSAVFIGATVNGRDFAPHFAAKLETILRRQISNLLNPLPAAKSWLSLPFPFCARRSARSARVHSGLLPRGKRTR